MTFEKNRARAFADVVNLDAWHDAFSDKNKAVDLHVDVAFQTAFMGAEVESPIRFKLGLSRAEVVVVISPVEPVSVVHRSISLDAPTLNTSQTKILSHKDIDGFKARLLAILSGKNSKVDGSLSVLHDESRENSYKYEEISRSNGMKVTHFQSRDGYHRWILEPASRSSDQDVYCLEGRPWDAHASPRLKIKDKRPAKSKSVPPSITVELRCHRQDIIISKMEPKDPSLAERILGALYAKNKLLAAEALILKYLSSEGLGTPNLSEPFESVTIASVQAGQEDL